MKISNKWIALLFLFCIFGIIDSIETLLYYEDPFPDVPHGSVSVWRSEFVVSITRLGMLAFYSYCIFILVNLVRQQLDTTDFIIFKIALTVFLVIWTFGFIRGAIILELWGSTYEHMEPPSTKYYLSNIFWIVTISTFLLKHKVESQ